MSEELKRFEVTLTRNGSAERMDTFTWGVTRDDAYNRVAQTLDHDSVLPEPAWVGWSFAVADEPTEINS